METLFEATAVKENVNERGMGAGSQGSAFW